MCCTQWAFNESLDKLKKKTHKKEVFALDRCKRETDLEISSFLLIVLVVETLSKGRLDCTHQCPHMKPVLLSLSSPSVERIIF